MRSKEVEDRINNLKRYIAEDLIYQENKPESDFDEFCINHCKDIHTILSYIEELENKLKQAKEYINEEMYVDYNVTFSSEEDFYNDLPCSLNLHNEDLRKLLEILGE